jgi:hypothetical protein
MVACVLALFCGAGCGLLNPTKDDPSIEVSAQGGVFTVTEHQRPVFSAQVLKWYDGHRAAVSLTYDNPWGVDRRHQLVTDAAIQRGLCMDLELVSAIYQTAQFQPALERMRTELMPRGIHLFGHGHQHVNHDSLGYAAALASFRLNYALMEGWGLQPRAYAYPGSAGRNRSTQLACQQAGFICARGSTVSPDSFYICPDSVLAPKNWYYLPAVVMAQEFPSYVNDHQELLPVLETALAKGAWVILIYHAVGIPEGWGHYPLQEYLADLGSIAAADFWSTNMDRGAAYIRERQAFAIELASDDDRGAAKEYGLVFRDGLDNQVYDQPLTVELRIDPGLAVQRAYLEPPVESGGSYELTGDRFRVNLVPDEKQYTLRLE